MGGTLTVLSVARSFLLAGYKRYKYNTATGMIAATRTSPTTGLLLLRLRLPDRGKGIGTQSRRADGP